MKISGNEPAHPTLEQGYDAVGGIIWRTELGLTIRQQFAMAAMQGLLASDSTRNWNREVIAKESVVMADALINELNK